MNIKEQESQLKLNINFEIIFSIFLWLALAGFVAYRLWSINTVKESPLTISNNVPTIKQANLDILRTSIKTTNVSNLPLVRPEPFD